MTKVQLQRAIDNTRYYSVRSKLQLQCFTICDMHYSHVKPNSKLTFCYQFTVFRPKATQFQFDFRGFSINAADWQLATRCQRTSGQALTCLSVEMANHLLNKHFLALALLSFGLCG